MPDRYNDLGEYDWLQEQIVIHETRQAQALGKLILEKWGPKDTIDIGCGPGIYLLPFKEADCAVFGVDGAPAAGKFLTPHEFELADLRQPWSPPRYFDLALCIEVGEHLKREFHPTLVETVTKCAPLVFWSAAHPGQGGEGHYGEATKEYWIDLFSEQGFVHDTGLTGTLMEAINRDEVYNHCEWLKTNSMVLRKA